MADPLERLTNLVALLLETRAPLTFEQIRFRMSGQYPEREDARRAAFDRDKTVLREVGIEIEQQVLGGNDAGKTAYWIDRDKYELQDLGLDDDERRALQVALAAVHVGPDWTDQAMLKLGAGLDSGQGFFAAMLDSSDNLPLLFEAANNGWAVRFAYRGKQRAFEPWWLLSRGGFWYAIGWDADEGQQRTYRVDRIDGEVTSSGVGSNRAPEGFDPASAFEDSVRSIGAEAGPTVATVLVNADRAAGVRRELGEGAVVETRADGSIVVSAQCSNRLMFRAWVLGFADHAEVLGPPEVRSEIVEWLQGMVPRG